MKKTIYKIIAVAMFFLAFNFSDMDEIKAEEYLFASCWSEDDPGEGGYRRCLVDSCPWKENRDPVGDQFTCPSIH